MIGFIVPFESSTFDGLFERTDSVYVHPFCAQLFSSWGRLASSLFALMPDDKGKKGLRLRSKINAMDSILVTQGDSCLRQTHDGVVEKHASYCSTPVYQSKSIPVVVPSTPSLPELSVVLIGKVSLKPYSRARFGCFDFFLN